MAVPRNQYCPIFNLQTADFKNNLRVGGDLTVEGTITFGDAVLDSFIVKGRMATSTAAGAALVIDATYLYGEGQEYRYQVTNWTGAGSSFSGSYMRAEAATNSAAGKSLYGTQVYGVCNNVTMTTGSLWGTLTYAYVKGVDAVTINNLYAGQFELTWDASRTGDCTISTEAAVILAKVTGGRVADYTKIHGQILRFGEMDGDSQKFGNGILIEDDSAMGGTSTLTKGIHVNIGCDVGLSFTGAYADSCIDFTNVVLDHGGSSGPVMMRAGTYGSPVTSSDSGQSGMLRLYGRNSALTDTESSGFYDRGVFVCLKTTGAKGQIPVAGLVEIEATVSGDGPVNVKGAEFIVNMTSVSSKLAATAGVGGMFGAWCKITAVDGATCHANSLKAAIWLDNQMNGNNAAPGEEYAVYATTGGLKPDAFIGFATTSAGWSNFLSFDDTSYDQDPVGSADIDAGTTDKYLKVNINGTAYGIPMYHSW